MNETPDDPQPPRAADSAAVPPPTPADEPVAPLMPPPPPPPRAYAQAGAAAGPGPAGGGGGPYYYGGPGYVPPPPGGGWGPPPPPPPKPRGPLRRALGVCGWLLLVVLALVGVAAILEHDHAPSAGLVRSGSSVGLVRIEGIIMHGEDYDFWDETLRGFAEDRHLRGVVVRIDSPGGAVGASQELQSALIRLRHEGKRVYVSMGDMAASGGYYIASAADQVYALKGTLTGSIGVILSKPNLSGLTDKIGYRTEIVKSGRFKDSMSTQRGFTDPERQMFDQLIGNTYEQFLTDVIAFRRPQLDESAARLTPEQWTAYQFTRTTDSAATTATGEVLLRQIADGRVYTGEQGLELGLVDQIGTLEDTIDALGERLGIGPRPDVIEPQRRKTWREMLASSMAQAMGQALPEMREGLHYRMSLP